MSAIAWTQTFCGAAEASGAIPRTCVGPQPQERASSRGLHLGPPQGMNADAADFGVDLTGGGPRYYGLETGHGDVRD